MLFTKRMKRVIALLAAVLLAMSLLAGCGEKEQTSDGQVTISVGNWPAETHKNYETMEAARKEFMEKNPDIIVKGDPYRWEAKTFVMMASSGQLPTLTLIPFTEANKSKTESYAADVTEVLKKYGFMESMNPSMLELLTDENGKVYGIPNEAYSQGLYLLKPLMKEAGLVNADGSIMIPSTYDEVAEFGKIIREKTGRAGFIYPTTGNGGGWNLLNIAWSFGTEFLEKDIEGNYTAAFDSAEFKAALQYLYDLKWKYNAVQDNNVVSVEEQRKLFGTYQGAMTIYNPPGSEMVQKYGTNKDDMVAARVPAGPAGRFSQMGGNYWVVAANATPEQQDAAMRWLEFRGITPKATEEQKSAWVETNQQNAADGYPVLGRSAFPMWVNPERIKAEEETTAPYVNIDPKDYDDYFSFTGVTIRPEPEVCAQELYSVLDKGVQEIFTNQNVDLDALIDELVKDFQLNHLDKLR